MLSVLGTRVTNKLGRVTATTTTTKTNEGEVVATRQQTTNNNNNTFRDKKDCFTVIAFIALHCIALINHDVSFELQKQTSKRILVDIVVCVCFTCPRGLVGLWCLCSSLGTWIYYGYKCNWSKCLEIIHDVHVDVNVDVNVSKYECQWQWLLCTTSSWCIWRSLLFRWWTGLWFTANYLRRCTRLTNARQQVTCPL